MLAQVVIFCPSSKHINIRGNGSKSSISSIDDQDLYFRPSCPIWWWIVDFIYIVLVLALVGHGEILCLLSILYFVVHRPKTNLMWLPLVVFDIIYYWYVFVCFSRFYRPFTISNNGQSGTCIKWPCTWCNDKEWVDGFFVSYEKVFKHVYLIGLVSPWYGNMGIGQHQFRLWLVAWRHQSVLWSSGFCLSIRLLQNYLSEILLEFLKIFF